MFIGMPFIPLRLLIELHPNILPATAYFSKIDVEFIELQELAQWDTRDN